MSTPNRLYFGDCLEVMRADLPSESVDLIYLDPPFNSKRLYNAFIGGAQWIAFNDTWRWHEAIGDFHEVASQPHLAKMIEGLRMMLGEGSELAYLSYMANRLVECHRVLKPTGSIYLHCDPTMSHYLKAIMDGIFGRKRFRNEVVWCYNLGGRISKRAYGRRHDTILFYTKSSEFTFNWDAVLIDWDKQGAAKFRHEDEHGRYRLIGRFLKNSPIKGHRDVSVEWERTHPELVQRYYMKTGKAQVDFWNIPPVNQVAKERMGYPTQKPLPLLDRIIKASSNPGDLVLDPFCGCGTTVHSAQNLDRSWVGIDICVNACREIEQRLRSHFDSLWSEVEFIGMPKTVDDARFMASGDAFRFERWAAALVDGMEPNVRQRGDGGIDGWGRLPIRKGQFVDIVSQVKGGSTNPGHVQAFNGARQQAGADLGIFTCFEDKVTTGMRNAAASTGFFMETPIVQIYTVEDYFVGRRPLMPVASY